MMYGMNALITIAKHWRRGSDPRLIVLVLNDRDLNQVNGLKGVRVESPEEIGDAWDGVLAADRRTLKVPARPELNERDGGAD
jgi:pyruvate dehydrogenase (quinone)